MALLPAAIGVTASAIPAGELWCPFGSDTSLQGVRRLQIKVIDSEINTKDVTQAESSNKGESESSTHLETWPEQEEHVCLPRSSQLRQLTCTVAYVMVFTMHYSPSSARTSRIAACSTGVAGAKTADGGIRSASAIVGFLQAGKSLTSFERLPLGVATLHRRCWAPSQFQRPTAHHAVHHARPHLSTQGEVF